jgi:hypothetical protein
MAASTRSDRYEPPCIEERADITLPLIGGLLTSNQIVPG